MLGGNICLSVKHFRIFFKTLWRHFDVLCVHPTFCKIILLFFFSKSEIATPGFKTASISLLVYANTLGDLKVKVSMSYRSQNHIKLKGKISDHIY